MKKAFLVLTISIFAILTGFAIDFNSSWIENGKVSVSQWTNLETAIDELSVTQTQVTLVIDQDVLYPYLKTENLTIPSHISLEFTRDGRIVLNNIYSVFIEGSVDAGNWQIIEYEKDINGNLLANHGTAVFYNVDAVRPEWFYSGNTLQLQPNYVFEDYTEAIQYASNSARQSKTSLKLSARKYIINDTLDFTGLNVQGAGMQNTQIHAFGHDTSNPYFAGDIIRIDGYETTLSDFEIIGPDKSVITDETISVRNFHGTATTGNAITVKNDNNAFLGEIFINRIKITDVLLHGIYFYVAGYSTIENVIIEDCGQDAIFLDGIGPDPANCITTISIDNAQISNLQFGYAINMKNNICVTVSNVMAEDTKGIKIHGIHNKNIRFSNVRQKENSSGRGPNFLELSGGGRGISVEMCYSDRFDGNAIDAPGDWDCVSIFNNYNLSNITNRPSNGYTAWIIDWSN